MRLRILLLALVMTLSGQARAQDTLALWDFDNNTLGTMADIQAAEPLTRVLPEALLSRLSQAPGLRVVERVKLREVLDEQKLGSSELAAQEGRLQLGRILGARGMIFGEYVVMGPVVRVDVRVVDVETSQVLFSEPVQGAEADVIAGMGDLASVVAQHFGQKLLADAGHDHAPQVWLAYDKGLREMDARRYLDAVETFKSVLKINPTFTPAERQIVLALERLARQK